MGLVRSTSVIVVELCAEVQGCDFFLLLKHMFTDSGTVRRDLDMRVTRKLLVDEEIEPAIRWCLSENLQISERVCKDGFAIEAIKDTKVVQPSEGFPGLMTNYHLHVARVRMHGRCLPTCTEFMTSVEGT